jgi:hypothetical protein
MGGIAISSVSRFGAGIDLSPHPAIRTADRPAITNDKQKLILAIFILLTAKPTSGYSLIITGKNI